MVLIGGVARAFHLNMVPEAVSKKLEPMINTLQKLSIAKLTKVEENSLGKLIARRMADCSRQVLQLCTQYVRHAHLGPWRLFEVDYKYRRDTPEAGRESV